VTDPRPRSQVLASLVREHGWRHGAELGVLHGKTFFHLLDTCPELHLIGVDTWRCGDPALEPPLEGRRSEADSGYRSYSDLDLPLIGQQVMEKAAAYGERARIFDLSTRSAVVYVKNASLDFVFIDADHTEAGVRQDIIDWRPKVRPGGWLMGHDSNFASVRRAIDDLCPGWRQHEANIWSLPA
jgi:hypothetical protein